MALDLWLAIAHHLAVFAIAALLAARIAMVRAELTAASVRVLALVDAAYGAAAGAAILAGFARVFWGVKPESFYLENWVFWAKIGAIAVVGAISIVPTRRFTAWRRAAAADESPAPAAVRQVRPYLYAEAAVFVLIPTFAALMARGYGL